MALGYPAGAVAAPAASVRLVDCVPAAAAADRSATFEARARATADSAQMQVRFTLQVRDVARGGWRRVIAEGFDEWLSSDAGVRRYSYARTVENLLAPAAYRTLVRFRWLDAGGAVLKGARIASASCRQPDLRPDLSALALSVLPGPDEETRRYAVSVRNAGRSAAHAFTVGLRVGERELEPVALAGLGAGATGVLGFTGPACNPDLLLTVTVDAAGAVEERGEGDNVMVASCLP